MGRLEEKKRRKRKLRLRRVFGMFLILTLLIGLYSIFQYQTGVLEAANGKSGEDEITADDFNGKLSKDGQINVLLIGSDSRGEEAARTDSILIAHYDQHTHQPKIVSIMRDTYVKIPGYGKHKINTAYALGGLELLRKTIEENFDVDIHYYAVVDFKGFSHIVDAVAPDGIEVDIPYTMSHGIGMTLNPGKQTLHGNELLGYVRFRHDHLSDFGRVERQQEVLSKLKKEAADIGNIFKIPKILGLASPYIDTNLGKKTFFILGKDFVTGQAKDVEKLRIPVNGTYENKRYAQVGEVLSIDLRKNQDELKKFLTP